MRFFNRQGRALLMLTAVVVAFGAVSEVSAVDLSVGGGVVFNSNFGGGYTLEGTFSGDDWRTGDVRWAISTPYTAFGINAFVDATYAEVSIALVFAGGTWKTEYEDENSDGVSSLGEAKTSATEFNLGLLAKYPIMLSNAMTLFPAIGFDYEICVSGKSKEDDRIIWVKWDGKENRPEAGDISRLWFKFGVVGDYALGKQLYLRSELLYGIGLTNKYEDYAIRQIKKSNRYSDETEVVGQLSHGLTIKAGIGYKF